MEQVAERRRRSCLDHPVSLVNPLLQYTTGWSCRRTFDNRKLSSKMTQIHGTLLISPRRRLLIWKQRSFRFPSRSYLPSFPSLAPSCPLPVSFSSFIFAPADHGKCVWGIVKLQIGLCGAGRQTTLGAFGAKIASDEKNFSACSFWIYSRNIQIFHVNCSSQLLNTLLDILLGIKLLPLNLLISSHLRAVHDVSCHVKIYDNGTAAANYRLAIW